MGRRRSRFGSCVGLSLALAAPLAFADGLVEELTGTTWSLQYTNADGEMEYDVRFLPGGRLFNAHPNESTPDNDRWAVEGGRVVMRFNNGFAVYTGTLSTPERMTGSATNRPGSRWTWVAEREGSGSGSEEARPGAPAVREVETVSSSMTGGASLPFRFNDGASYVISLNTAIPGADEVREELARRLAAAGRLDEVVLDPFGSGRSMRRVEVKVGRRVPVEIAQAALWAVSERSGGEIVGSVMADDDDFGNTQRIYVGGLAASGGEPAGAETLNALLADGVGRDRFFAILSGAEGAEAGLSGSAPPGEARPGPVEGRWKEFWGIPGQTDVTYHDQYRISRAKDGTVEVEILNRDQLIENARFEEGVLRFEQHTSFTVSYSLALHPDGKTLEGTATTPSKVVPVRWERIGRD